MNEEINEKVEDAAQEIQEEAAEITEEVKDEVAEAAENADETVEEAAAEASEVTEEVTEETTENLEAAVEEAPKATVKKAAPVIKKKSKFNSTTLITIIVCAVIVLACVAFIGIRLKWFYVPAKASFTVDDYTTIEIDKADVEVTDDEIESALTSMQSYYTTTESVTEGEVEDGDTVHIVYTGTLEETGEEFDGGSTGDSGTDLTIGSGSYIDGFEDGLIGAEIGDTVSLDLTFPDDYSTEDLQGQDVTFEVTIESKSVTNTPDVDDDFIKENSAEYISYYYGEDDQQIDTVDDFKAWIKDFLYDSYLQNAIFEAMMEKIHVKTYDEINYENAKNYQLSVLSYYASMYGYDADTLATYYGATDADSYATEQAEYQLQEAMLFSKLADDLGIDHSDAALDENLTAYMEENGYSDSYTLEEFKEQNGEAWVYQYQNYYMISEEVVNALKDRVVFVEVEDEEDAEAEETEETEAEEDEETTAEETEEETTEAESETESETEEEESSTAA